MTARRFSRECNLGMHERCNGAQRLALHPNLRRLGVDPGEAFVPVSCECLHHVAGFDPSLLEASPGALVIHRRWRGSISVRARVVEAKTDVVLLQWGDGQLVWTRTSDLEVLSAEAVAALESGDEALAERIAYASEGGES